jgi:uncharacterized membrane protein YphA (DoxX/SURF4 family)
MKESVTNSWVLLFLRGAVGIPFLYMGVNKTFFIGLTTFAEQVFVKGFAGSWLPEPIRWVAGIVDPLALLVGGAALLLGFLTRWAAIGTSAFLMMIIFGHMVSDTFSAIAVGPLLYVAVLAFIIHLEKHGNRFSLDFVLRINKA